MPTDLYERITSRRGAMAKIGKRLPGYRGYMDAQARREADRLLRDHVVQQFKHQAERLPAIEKTLLDQEGGIQWMDDTANLKTNFQMLIDRIRAAERGHSGLFSNVKVDTEELEKLYAFDEAMLDYVDDLAARIDVLQQAAFSSAEIQEAIIRFDSLLREVGQAFDLRKQVMIGLAGEADQQDVYPL